MVKMTVKVTYTHIVIYFTQNEKQESFKIQNSNINQF